MGLRSRAAKTQARSERTPGIGSAPKRHTGTIRRVAEFLSPAWVAELDGALRSLESEPTSSAPPFVIEQRVTVEGRVDHVHHVVASGAGFRAVTGPAPEPDLVLTTDLDTAVAIQRGAVNAQLALAVGHLRLGGDLDRLLSRSELFAKLDDVFGALRESTTYPDAQSGRHRPSGTSEPHR